MGNTKTAQFNGRETVQSVTRVRKVERISKGNSKLHSTKPTVANFTADTQVDEHSLSNQELIKNIIRLMGDDPTREGLLDTPKRILKSYRELFAGYKMDPTKILTTTFQGEGYDEIVLLDNIEMYSTCEHHGLPFFGKAHVAYIPGERVVGLSKLARLVECFSRRLQIQERLTTQIAEALVDCLKPRAVGVVIQAKHFCMVSRGIGKQNSIMTTSCMKGLFKEDEKARSELLRLINI